MGNTASQCISRVRYVSAAEQSDWMEVVWDVVNKRRANVHITVRQQAVIPLKRRFSQEWSNYDLSSLRWSATHARSFVYQNSFRPNKPNQTVNDGVAHSKNPRKCAYHVTFDLDLDLEHTLDARWPGVHRMQVWWRSCHLSARRSDLRKSLQTDRQADRRTDDRRRAIAL